MQIFRAVKDFQAQSSRPLFLALGNFDGLHIGHQKILKRVISEAKRRGGRSAVFTFREHPEKILHPHAIPKLLSVPEQKLFLLESLGLELCFWIGFTRKFSKLSPHDFAEKILTRGLGVKKVFMGSQARFGHRRAGDAALMRKLGQRLGFEFEEIPPARRAGGIVSSSRIRRLVAEGRLELVRQCLGRPYHFFARVIRGAGRGKGLGYPTANLKVSTQVLPPQGVYPVACRILDLQKKGNFFPPRAKSPWLGGVLNYGIRPTFKDQAGPQLEVFLLDFRGNLYGKTLEVVFYPRLRAEKTFPNADKLKVQIARDVHSARRVLGRDLHRPRKRKELPLQTKAGKL